MILDEILIHKRREVLAAQQAVPFTRVKELALAAAPARPFGAALRPSSPEAPARVIAEIKKQSPARGALAPEMDVRAMARLYASGGAAAISVLTDQRFFAGSLDDLRAVRGEVDLPVLRKDFIIAPYQVFEARAAGADAALLIVGALASPLASLADLAGEVAPGEPDLVAGARRLRRLLDAAASAGIECLVEVHDEAELEVALDAGAPILGVNNRDLRTFETSLAITERLAPRVPPDILLVGESGIDTAADARRLRRAGVSAVLVGSAIVGASDPRAKLEELVRGSGDER